MYGPADWWRSAGGRWWCTPAAESKQPQRPVHDHRSDHPGKLVAASFVELPPARFVQHPPSRPPTLIGPTRTVFLAPGLKVTVWGRLENNNNNDDNFSHRSTSTRTSTSTFIVPTTITVRRARKSSQTNNCEQPSRRSPVKRFICTFFFLRFLFCFFCILWRVRYGSAPVTCRTF